MLDSINLPELIDNILDRGYGFASEAINPFYYPMLLEEADQILLGSKKKTKLAKKLIYAKEPEVALLTGLAISKDLRNVNSVFADLKFNQVSYIYYRGEDFIPLHKNSINNKLISIMINIIGTATVNLYKNNKSDVAFFTSEDIFRNSTVLVDSIRLTPKSMLLLRETNLGEQLAYQVSPSEEPSGRLALHLSMV